MKQEAIKRVVISLKTLVALSILALFIFGVVNILVFEKSLTEKIETYGIPAIFISSFLLDMIPQPIPPKIVLLIGIVSGLNPILVTLATIAGSGIGSILGFTIGERHMFGLVSVLVNKKSTKRLELLVNRYGKIIVPIAAFSPIPYLPLVLGAMKMSRRNFIFYGIIPRAISLAIVGWLISLI